MVDREKLIESSAKIAAMQHLKEESSSTMAPIFLLLQKKSAMLHASNKLSTSLKEVWKNKDPSALLMVLNKGCLRIAFDSVVCWRVAVRKNEEVVGGAKIRKNIKKKSDKGNAETDIMMNLYGCGLWCLSSMN